MSSREEYLAKAKAKLDEWDADIDRLEAKANEAQADAQVIHARAEAEARIARSRR